MRSIVPQRRASLKDRSFQRFAMAGKADGSGIRLELVLYVQQRSKGNSGPGRRVTVSAMSEVSDSRSISGGKTSTPSVRSAFRVPSACFAS